MDACIANMGPELVPVEVNGKAPTGSCESSLETASCSSCGKFLISTLQNVLKLPES